MKTFADREILNGSMQPDPESMFEQRLDQAIERARKALFQYQHPEGYWCFELEADCTISAEYIMMMHFMGDIDPSIEAKIAAYLRARQNQDGGWYLYYGGDSDLSCSVKAYYALKLAGDSPDARHMSRAREYILANGGAARSNVFTHYAMALFGQIPWRGVPFLPVEIMLLPRWFPFHINKVSYWSRTVMIPLAILFSLRARARNPRGIHIQELFVRPPEKEKDFFPVRSPLNRLFLYFERNIRHIESLIPKWVRRRAIKRAEKWIIERLNGTDGLGGIFPAMVNALEALTILGYPPDHSYRVSAKKALEGLLVVNGEQAYCQPCVSPVWDTALSALSLLEAESGAGNGKILKALDWLKERQVLNGTGDWRKDRPKLRAGGWAFQFQNDHYTDLDDTAAVARLMCQVNPERFKESIDRAAEWLCGMQSKNGGFAAFDVNNTHYYLNEIPFADHGALLDPPTVDVSARCATLLHLHNHLPQYRTALNACIRYLIQEQEEDGSWFGRWGTNYIYGTWSVLDALGTIGIGRDQPEVNRAITWLKDRQNTDGGWREGCCSYYCDEEKDSKCWESTSFQTSWALLGLMAIGDAESDAVRRGIEFLIQSQTPDGLWNDQEYTAPGFPRVFYLRYHGYYKYFPLWALARYRNLRRKGKA
jgi:squalene-hopene/tetraprenyl-beta-curcumene cyclase